MDKWSNHFLVKEDRNWSKEADAPDLQEPDAGACIENVATTVSDS